ncbi:MAG: nucleotide exchange factor GrpE [Nitrospirota bacterium]|nr:nucleotide exchange factor GrpE [Nitrospirota bacterium]
MTEQDEDSMQDLPEGEETPSMEELAAAAEEAAAATEKDRGARELLEQKTKEAAEAQERYLRTYADFENYRKRMQRDMADFRKYANEQMAQELLTVVDHLGLALKHATDSGETSQGLVTGVELVYKQFRDVLEKFGIKPFLAEGEPFDPAKHDAMMQVETADVPESTVVQVFQDGYLYHDKILRHAKVSVSKRPAANEEAATA